MPTVSHDPPDNPRSAGRRLCAHANDNHPMHWLEPGETCPAATPPGDPVYTYSTAVNRAQREVDERLETLRRELEAGEISIRAAADERVLLLSEHLARLARLRADLLGLDNGD